MGGIGAPELLIFLVILAMLVAVPVVVVVLVIALNRKGRAQQAAGPPTP